MACPHRSQAGNADHPGRPLESGAQAAIIATERWHPLATRHTGAVAVGLLVTLLATTLLLGRSLVGVGNGVYLFRDFVTVPDPVLGENLLGGSGAPRAVPLDAVVAALSSALPPELLGRGLLVAPLLLVGSGMTLLLQRYGGVATAVGSGLAILNPYVAERLLLGQSPSLLGYAMIPWLVAAVRVNQPLSIRILLVLTAALPAALTPVGAVTAGITVLVAALALGPRRPEGREPLRHRAVAALGLLVPVALLSVPWVLAALEHPGAGAVRDGADAFAVRSDGYLAVAGSVATLGGVWAEGAWPDSRANGFVTVLALFLVLGAGAAWYALRGQRGPSGGPGVAADRRSVDLAAAGYALTVVTALALAGPLLPVWRVGQEVPGVALLRDTHRMLGWAALAVAALLAVGLAQALRHLESRRLAGAGLALTLLAAGVLTVPDVSARLARDVRPVAVPPEWDDLVGVLNDGTPGAVLLLPWQPFRQVDWVGPVQFLDPLPRALEPEVVHARDLLVRRDGTQWWVGGEDPAIGESVDDGDDVLDPDLLAEEGISRVVIWLDSPGELPRDEALLPEVHRGEHWLVLEVPAHSP